MPTREKKRRPRNRFAIASLAVLLSVVVGALVALLTLDNSKEEVSPLILYEHFKIHFAAERYVEAIIVADELIERYPRNAVYYMNRATAKANLGRHQEAIIDFGRAIELRPALDPQILQNILVTAHYDRGVTYAQLGKMDEARADWRRALELARKDNDSDWIARAEDTLKRHAAPEAPPPAR